MNWELLKKLSDTPAIAGMEDEVREVMISEMEKLGAEVKVDAIGNVIGHISGSGPKLLLDAHMDEIGFMVRHIDANGFIRVVPVGGVDVNVFYGQRVLVCGKEKMVGIVGSTPPHIARDTQAPKDTLPPSLEDCFIDLGISAEKVHKLVKIGDAVTFLSPCVENSESLIGKSFDDRVGLFVMLESVRLAKSRSVDLWLVSSVQEEMGLRGAGPAAYFVKPDIMLALEGTVASDTPGVPEHKTLAKQGHGPEIRLSDSRFVASRKWAFFIVELAQKRKIAHQVIVKRVGGTDAATAQTTGLGTHTTALSVPVRYIHSANSIARKDDIESAIKLTSAIIEEAGKFKHS